MTQKGMRWWRRWEKALEAIDRASVWILHLLSWTSYDEIFTKPIHGPYLSSNPFLSDKSPVCMDPYDPIASSTLNIWHHSCVIKYRQFYLTRVEGPQ